MGTIEEYRLILTNDLKKQDIPTGILGWRQFSVFALTFNPRLDPLSEEEMVQMGQRDPQASHTLKSLRARLYNWQRIYNNRGSENVPPDFYHEVANVIGWIEGKLA
jgi:hypothetical protein